MAKRRYQINVYYADGRLGSEHMVGTAKQARDTLREMRESGIPPSRIKTSFNPSLLDEYIEEEAGGRKAFIGHTSWDDKPMLKPVSKRRTTPAKSSSSSEFVGRGRRRHLRAY